MTPTCPYAGCTQPADTIAFPGSGGTFCSRHAAAAEAVITESGRRSRRPLGTRVSEDLHTKILHSIHKGISPTEISSIHHVSTKTIERIKKTAATTK